LFSPEQKKALLQIKCTAISFIKYNNNNNNNNVNSNNFFLALGIGDALGTK